MEGAKATELQEFFTKDRKVEISNVALDEQSGIFALTLQQLTDKERQEHLEALRAKYGIDKVQDIDFSSISPSVSEEIKNKALMAIMLVIFGISLYIAFVFRKVSRPVSSWKYGIVTLITLFHDVIIPAGVFAALSYFMGATLDVNFIVALLVVMGFSVHDTIVVFDRIRENLQRIKGKHFAEIVNTSINETIRRSVNTSLTLIVVLIALYFLGPVSLKYFVLTMLIGTTAGTYSSIFVASPLLVLWQKFSGGK